MAKDTPNIRAMKSLSQKEVAWLIGLTDRQVRNCDDCPRRDDGKYDAAAVVQWHVERSTSDPMVSSESTPALERWRLARARTAEDDLATRRGQLVEADVVRECAGRAFAPIRRFAEEQIKQYGGVTQDAWNDAVERFRRELQSIIRERDDSGVRGLSDTEAPASNHGVG